MNNFSFPAEPTANQDAFEAGLGRWLLVALPVILLGHLLGGLALVAALMSANFNILGWLE